MGAAEPARDRDAYVEALEAENERLQARNQQLEDALVVRFVPPVEWRLTGAEAVMVGVLLARDLCTKDAFMAALYRNQGRDEAEVKIVDVFICKLRKKLKPFGLEVSTVWGLGYRFSAEMRARAAALIAGEAVT